MAETEAPPEQPQAESAEQPYRLAGGRMARRLILGVIGFFVLIGVAVLMLDTQIGKRFVADQIASTQTESELSVKVGRIEGSIFSEAVLRDVVASDQHGEFLVIPEVELEWRPLRFLFSGLDIREVVARRGTLLRIPEPVPTDSTDSGLPGFDISIDHFAIEQLTVASGIAGDEEQQINLDGKLEYQDRRFAVQTEGTFGGNDRIAALVDASPDAGRFDVDVTYVAERDGVLAALVGAQAGYTARVRGDGNWDDWTGALVVRRDGDRFAAFKLTNRAGLYGVSGQMWPSGAVEGVPAQLLGDTVSLAAFTTLENSIADLDFALRTSAINAGGRGAIDLSDTSFDGLRIAAQLRDPDPLGSGIDLQDARLAAILDGPLSDLEIEHELAIGQLVSGETRLAGLVQQGTATWSSAGLQIPLDVAVARVATGNAWLDPRLVDGTLDGSLSYTGSRLFSERLDIVFPGASARLALRGDTSSGAYALAGPVTANGLVLDNIGTLNAGADIVFTIGNAPWTLRADFDGRIPNVSNATLANLAGPAIAFQGGVGIGGAQPLTFRNVRLGAQKLRLTLDGRVVDGRTSVAGRGTHTDYGAFTVDAALTDAGPEAVLVFANPYPAAGLRDVRVAISPTEDGFGIETQGDSTLGPFDGVLGLYAPEGGPTRIAVERLDIWKTSVTGDIALGDAGANGTLTLAGGGLDGTIALAPRGGGQAFDIALQARNAQFAGATPISISRARINGSGLLVDGNSDIELSVFAQGLGYGNLYLGRLAAQAELTNGSGAVTASLAGRRGSRLNLQLNAGIAPERLTMIARGDFAGQRISMPRRAVLLKQDDGGWQLQRTQLSYGGGVTLAEGSFGGGTTALDLQLSKMPLSLVDLAVADFGLGGTISGLVDFRLEAGGAPTGSARVVVNQLTRSGLVLTSLPVDLSLVANLRPDRLEARAVVDEGGERRGRLQARIAGMPASGALYDRLQTGDLFAQLRYQGPAAALWRLAAIDAFDLTGPVSVAANATGSLADPQVRGSVASNDLRVRSGLSGTDVRDVTARGTFSGSRLRLTRFAGSTGNGGRVSGSGTVDLARLGEPIAGEAFSFRGPQLDLRMAADNAQLLDANGLSATVTGPLRVISNGNGGTIAGRLRVNRASWRLGTAADAEQLPRIRTREINVPSDIGPVAARSAPWRYLIDARAPSRVDVDGMGLDSEWSADIRLRGTTDDPRIGGEARVVRGAYSFAGNRFELTRGRIAFDENVPIDPRLDIVAESDRDGLSVAVNVRGTAVQPEISFSSTPALPEEEILARLLFGGSITELSATDAVQLGAAVASLRGGGGMDPINELRSAIGLDRLRIVGADPALGRGTGVALGKNFGRRTYVEIITDGQGYSATEVEFRVTSWLSLLGTISTVGREAALAEISKDY